MNKLENIIFDFGGVLYDIDLDLSLKEFQKIGLHSEEFKEKLYPVFINLETGKINRDQFIIQLQHFSSNNLNGNDIISAFNKILVGINPVKVAQLREFRKKFRLYLLSNTNEIHFNVFSEEIKNNPLTSDFYELFEKEYYSHLIGMRKPDSEIFEYVLKNSRLNPFGTLFVDDSYENISAAASLGIQTFWIENDESWEQLLKLLNNS